MKYLKCSWKYQSMLLHELSSKLASGRTWFASSYTQIDEDKHELVIINSNKFSYQRFKDLEFSRRHKHWEPCRTWNCVKRSVTTEAIQGTVKTFVPRNLAPGACINMNDEILMFTRAYTTNLRYTIRRLVIWRYIAIIW